MPKKLAVDLSGNQPRAVVASVASGSVTILKAAQLAADGLGDFVKENKLSGVETLVLAGRRDVEVRNLTLPPVTDDDLPDMVRLQAIRKFSAATDRSPVDYVLLDRSPENVQVMAATITSEAMNRIRKDVAAADLSLQRVAMRSLCVSALATQSRTRSSDDFVALVQVDDETELVVFRNGKLGAIRTVRTPAALDAAATAKALAGEIKRTRLSTLAESESLSNLSDASMDWWGDAATADALSTESGDIATVRSLSDVCSIGSGVSLPDDASSFAPLVGALLADATGDPSINFANPKRRPEPKPNRLRTAALIATPLLLIGGLGYAVQSKLSSKDREIEILDEQLEAMAPSLEFADKSLEETEAIDQFLDGDVLWLDEVKRLAEKMPPSDQMMVKELKGTVAVRGGGGTLQVVGVVTNPNVLDQFADAIRSDAHRVQGDGASEADSKDSYRWTFDEKIVINPESIREVRYDRIAETESQESDSPVVEEDGGSQNDAGEVEASDLEGDLESGEETASDFAEVSR